MGVPSDFLTHVLIVAFIMFSHNLSLPVDIAVSNNEAYATVVLQGQSQSGSMPSSVAGTVTTPDTELKPSGCTS